MLTRTKLLSILTVLTLLFAAPLMAQVANLSNEAPLTQNSAQQEEPATDTDVDVEADADAAVEEDSASAEASLSADTDSGVDSEAEAEARAAVQADVETDTEPAESNDSRSDDDSMSAQDVLPETAGSLGLLAVLGSAGLASAFGLRRLRRS